MGHIEDFVWKFCVNYLPLSSVTGILAYPIPCCDLVVSEELRIGRWMQLYDAPSGYHRLAVALASQEKLGF